MVANGFDVAQNTLGYRDDHITKANNRFKNSKLGGLDQFDKSEYENKKLLAKFLENRCIVTYQSPY